LEVFSLSTGRRMMSTDCPPIAGVAIAMFSAVTPVFSGPTAMLLLKTLPAMDVKLELKAPTLLIQLLVPVALCDGVCAVISA
jgi:hypothetical protein